MFVSIRNTFAIKINELISLPGTCPSGTNAINVDARQSTSDRITLHVNKESPEYFQKVIFGYLFAKKSFHVSYRFLLGFRELSVKDRLVISTWLQPGIPKLLLKKNNKFDFWISFK